MHTMYFQGVLYTRPSMIADMRNQFLPHRRPAPVLYPVDLATWDDRIWGDSMYTDSKPDDLNEPWPYRFKRGDKVWVCGSDGEWYQGEVVGQVMQGKTKDQEDGLFWCAEFRMKRCRVRKWLSPLNGDIKPDNELTHQLLIAAGRLDTDSD